MRVTFLKSEFAKSWTAIIQTRKRHPAPHTTIGAFGMAVLWYYPERHLAVSIWSPSWARHFPLLGPRKLSFER